MDIGIKVSDFWEFSIAEVNDLLTSSRRMRELEFKEKVQLQFLQADALGNVVARMFDKKVPRMQPWDIYPALFEEERQKFEAYSQAEDLEKYKERRRAAMDRHNRKRKGGIE